MLVFANQRACKGQHASNFDNGSYLLHLQIPESSFQLSTTPDQQAVREEKRVSTLTAIHALAKMLH